MGYVGYRGFSESKIKHHYWPALIVKITFGIALGIMYYSFYGSGDTIYYYDQAARLSELGIQDFLLAIFEDIPNDRPDRAIYYIRIAAVIKFFTGADYWMLSAYFSLFSFYGTFYLADKLVFSNSELKLPSIVAWLYFPSIVFWSSGLLKECLVFGALSLLVGYYCHFRSNQRLSIFQIFLAIVSLMIIVFLKYYIAAIFLPLLAFLILYHSDIWNRWKVSIGMYKIIYSILLLLIPAVIFQYLLSPNLAFAQLWDIMLVNHNQLVQLNAEGAIHTLNWFGGYLDVLINVPYLWFSGVFRPVLGESWSFPMVMSCLENTFILVLALLATFYSIKSKVKWSIEAIVIILYVGFLSVLLAFSSPNFGTLARFKIYFVPYLILLIIYQLQSLFYFKKN